MSTISTKEMDQDRDNNIRFDIFNGDAYMIQP